MTQQLLVATVAEGCLLVLSRMKLDGIHFISTPCVNGYDDFKHLPNVVEFEGIMYGKSGHDSDKGIACYRSDMKIATVVR